MICHHHLAEIFTRYKTGNSGEENTGAQECYTRKKLKRTGMDRVGLRSEAMSWARRNRDVGESEMSCLKTQGLGLGFNF